MWRDWSLWIRMSYNQTKEGKVLYLQRCLPFHDWMLIGKRKEVEHEVVNHVAFITSLENPMSLGESVSDNETDSSDSQKAYRNLYYSWTQQSKNKLQLAHERLILTTQKRWPFSYFVSHPRSVIGGLTKTLHTNFVVKRDESDVIKSSLNKKHKTIKMLWVSSECWLKIRQLIRETSLKKYYKQRTLRVSEHLRLL